MVDHGTLYIVHCIDTEGPLDETLSATFERLHDIFNIRLQPTQDNLIKIQKREFDLGGIEHEVAKCFSKKNLDYNRTWSDIDQMLSKVLSKEFCFEQTDDFGGGWVYSWHCLDHPPLGTNPRRKDIGFGNIFRHYKQRLTDYERALDEINWHFHPLSLSRNPLAAATSYLNSYDVLLEILCRRLLDGWFPVVNRPGFHAERPDSHSFLEQWIPFDYANQSGAEIDEQPDLSLGRFGDWSRAPKTWRGYHPDHDDYQKEGSCRRRIFRCMNMGTRLRSLSERHVLEAFQEAESTGAAILAFADHDFRDIQPDVMEVRAMLRDLKPKFPNVKIKYSGAHAAAISLLGFEEKLKLILDLKIISNRVFVEVIQGEVFGPQPFLALQTKSGDYFHDNLDVIEPRKKWTYVLDSQTIPLEEVSRVGVGSAGKYGKFTVEHATPIG